MDILEHIKLPVEAEFEACKRYMRGRMTADDDFVQSMLDYVIDNTGKGVRPLLVLLSSRLNSSNTVGERSFLAAMLVEMIHTASLVHDDVIDESPMRRGSQSVNGRWGANSAVLCGDYILATAFDVGMRSGQYDIPTFIIGAMKYLCSGELVQNEYNRRMDMTRATYLDIIHKKTAVLLGTSAAVGALAVGADSQAVERMRVFGSSLGMAFQIKDDILDYDVCADTGKPSCNDLREGKITLPLLCVLEKADEQLCRHIHSLLRQAHSSDESVAELRGIVLDRGGIAAAEELMNGYIASAKSAVSGYAPSPVRDSLELLCSFVGDRQK